MSYLCPKTRSRDMSRTNIVFLAGHVSGVAPLIVSHGADSVAVQQTTHSWKPTVCILRSFNMANLEVQ